MTTTIEFFDVGDNEGDTKTLNRIVELKRQLFDSDPQRIRADLDSIRRSLFRSKFASAQRTIFACQTSRGSLLKIVATATARVSPTLKDLAGHPLGILGFFDAVNVPEATKNLFDAVKNWFAAQGCKSIVGPLNGDTWHQYRINVGPHEDPPFLLEPYNPLYYQQLFLDSGFEVVERYHSLRVDDIPAAMRALKPSFETASKKQYSFRPLEINTFERELDAIYDLSKRCFCDNFLYEDISGKEFHALYANARKITRKKLVWFALDKNGNEVGFLFTIPDYFGPIKAMKGERNWVAKARFLLSRHKVKTVNFKSIGVLPEHRRNGVAGALMYQAFVASHRMGFDQANLCLIRDGNDSACLDGGLGRVLRRYELYQTTGSRLND